MSNTDAKLELLSTRIHILVVALIVLAIILTAYMAVECALLCYSLYKKKQHKSVPGPDKVVVKGGKSKRQKSKSSKRKSKKSSKSSKSSKDGKSLKKSKSGKHKSKSGKKVSSSKASQSSAKSSVSVEPSAKEFKKAKRQESSKKAGGKVKASGKTQGRLPANTSTARGISNKSDFTSNATNTCDQRRAIPDQFVDEEVDTKTEEQIKRIPPQFDKTFETESDEKTVEQYRKIPDQFDKPPSPNRDLQLDARSLQQITAAVVAQLGKSQSAATPPTLSYGSNANLPTAIAPSPVPPQQLQQPSQPSQTQQSQQQEVAASQGQQELNVSPVQQLASKPAPFAQPVQFTGRQVDSVYFMENNGPNGEIQKASMPVQPNAANSLMIDSQNVVPVDAKQDPKPSA